jgi:hypothetical protein
MNNSGDAAEQVVRLSLEGFEVAAKLTGSAAKNIAVLLMSVLKEEQKTKGKQRLSNMIRSGKELKVYSVPNKDLKKFVSEAKRYGVLYCVLRDKGKKGDNTPVDIIARAEDASKIQRIFDKVELASVDSKATVISETQKDVDEREEQQKDKPEKSKTDIIADEALKKPHQKEGYAQENPIAAKTEKDPLSEPSSKSENTELSKGTADKQSERPSVREKLNRYVAQSKQQDSERYQPQHAKEKSKQPAQTKHKQPRRRKPRHAQKLKHVKNSKVKER